MASASSVSQFVTELAPSFGGQLLPPADSGYEEARRVHNGLVNKRPALIARCKGTADIVDAVTVARKLHLEVAVRGGGVAGRSTLDGGLKIDLAPMKGIHVDPKTRTARVPGRARFRTSVRRPSQGWAAGTTSPLTNAKLETKATKVNCGVAL